jgi:hypothetical protein
MARQEASLAYSNDVEVGFRKDRVVLNFHTVVLCLSSHTCKNGGPFFSEAFFRSFPDAFNGDVLTR